MRIKEHYINSNEEIRKEIRELNKKLDDLNDIDNKDWFVHRQIIYIMKNIKSLKRQLRFKLNDNDLNNNYDDFDEQININLEVIKCSLVAFFICVVLLLIPFAVYDFDLINRETLIYLQILIVIIFIILTIVVCNWDELYNIKYN